MKPTSTTNTVSDRLPRRLRQCRHNVRRPAIRRILLPSRVLRFAASLGVEKPCRLVPPRVRSRLRPGLLHVPRADNRGRASSGRHRGQSLPPPKSPSIRQSCRSCQKLAAWRQPAFRCAVTVQSVRRSSSRHGSRRVSLFATTAERPEPAVEKLAFRPERRCRSDFYQHSADIRLARTKPAPGRITK